MEVLNPVAFSLSLSLFLVVSLSGHQQVVCRLSDNEFTN